MLAKTSDEINQYKINNLQLKAKLSNLENKMLKSSTA